MFAMLKDWRRISTRYDRCADLFLSACALAAIVMFWLWVLSLGQHSSKLLPTFIQSVFAHKNLRQPSPRFVHNLSDANFDRF
jgi:hypothetical protein